MLTEEQILKMSDEDYMNKEQLAFFRQRLLGMKQELMDVIEQARASLSAQEKNADPADVATLQEMQQLHLRTAERQTKLLHKIEASLKQIDAGEYGYCEETGEPIGIPRLLARPTATKSIVAKETQEYREKTEGHS